MSSPSDVTHGVRICEIPVDQLTVREAFVPRQPHRTIEIAVSPHRRSCQESARTPEATNRSTTSPNSTSSGASCQIWPASRETVRFICIVVVRREILLATFQRSLAEAVVMFDHRHAEFGCGNCIHDRDIGWRQVNRGNAACVVDRFRYGSEEFLVPGETTDAYNVRVPS